MSAEAYYAQETCKVSTAAKGRRRVHELGADGSQSARRTTWRLRPRRRPGRGLVAVPTHATRCAMSCHGRASRPHQMPVGVLCYAAASSGTTSTVPSALTVTSIASGSATGVMSSRSWRARS